MKTEAEKAKMRREHEELMLSTKKIKELIESCEDSIKREQAHHPNYPDELVILWLKEILRLRQEAIEQNSHIQRLRGILYQSDK